MMTPVNSAHSPSQQATHSDTLVFNFSETTNYTTPPQDRNTTQHNPTQPKHTHADIAGGSRSNVQAGRLLPLHQPPHGRVGHCESGGPVRRRPRGDRPAVLEVHDCAGRGSTCDVVMLAACPEGAAVGFCLSRWFLAREGANALLLGTSSLRRRCAPRGVSCPRTCMYPSTLRPGVCMCVAVSALLSVY